MSQFLQHTIRTNNDCLEWTRCLNTDGYPRAGRKGNSNLKVHREVFFEVNGYYPEVVRHTCDNIKCINPKHLVGGTNAENIRDRVERGRTFNHVSDEEIKEVVSLRKSGMYYKDISKKLGISIKRVEYIITRKAGKEV